MSNGIDDQAPAAVPFHRLPRKAHHRISEPTKDEVKAAVDAYKERRGHREPLIDAVLLASLRVADPDLVAAEVDKIELRELFPAPSPKPAGG